MGEDMRQDETMSILGEIIARLLGIPPANKGSQTNSSDIDLLTTNRNVDWLDRLGRGGEEDSPVRLYSNQIPNDAGGSGEYYYQQGAKPLDAGEGGISGRYSVPEAYEKPADAGGGPYQPAETEPSEKPFDGGGRGSGRYSTPGEFAKPVDAGGLEDIPDITGRLDRLMYEGERKYRDMPDKTWLDRPFKFKDLVESGGEYDLKIQPEWQNRLATYNGEIVRNDVPGNINYGHLGKVFGFPDSVLKAGAGLYQIRRRNSKPEWWNFTNFGDDPEDTKRIQQGIDIYNQRKPVY